MTYNADDVRMAASRIDRNLKAIDWLTKIGKGLLPQDIKTTFVTNAGSSANGYDEAMSAVAGTARIIFQELVAKAIEDCTDTIVQSRELIESQLKEISNG